MPVEQPNDDFIDEAAVATTVRGPSSAGTNCPEKQAWRMIRRFLNPGPFNIAASCAGAITAEPTAGSRKLRPAWGEPWLVV